MTSHFWIAVSFAEVGEAGEGGEGALHRVRLELVDRQRLLQVQPRRSLHLLGPFHPVPVGLLEHRLRDEVGAPVGGLDRQAAEQVDAEAVPFSLRISARARPA